MWQVGLSTSGNFRLCKYFLRPIFPVRIWTRSELRPFGSFVWKLRIARDGWGAMFRSSFPWLSWLQLAAQSDAASLARVVCTGAFCMGMLTAFAAVIPVSVSIVRPFLSRFWRHPVADLAALSAVSLPLRFWCAGIQWSSRVRGFVGVA